MVKAIVIGIGVSFVLLASAMVWACCRINDTQEDDYWTGY